MENEAKSLFASANVSLSLLCSSRVARVYCASQSNRLPQQPNKCCKQYAVKQIHIRHSEQVAQQARNELRALQALRGAPHVVQMFTCGQVDGHLYIITEWAEYGALDAFLARTGEPLSELASREVFEHLLRALQACHARGIIHHDVAPKNVLLRASGEAVLCDFGYASTFDVSIDERVVHNGMTPLYAAPERLDAKAPHSSSVDVWAAACVLFFCLTARDAFDAKSIYELGDMLLGPRLHGQTTRDIAKA